MTTTNVATYEQAVALQTRLVRRALLQPTQVHEIDEADERPEYGTVWLHCTCGHWTSFHLDDADRGERLYARHVTEGLRDTLAVAA